MILIKYLNKKRNKFFFVYYHFESSLQLLSPPWVFFFLFCSSSRSRRVLLLLLLFQLLEWPHLLSNQCIQPHGSQWKKHVVKFVSFSSLVLKRCNIFLGVLGCLFLFLFSPIDCSSFCSFSCNGNKQSFWTTNLWFGYNFLCQDNGRRKSGRRRWRNWFTIITRSKISQQVYTKIRHLQFTFVNVFWPLVLVDTCPGDGHLCPTIRFVEKSKNLRNFTCLISDGNCCRNFYFLTLFLPYFNSKLKLTNNKKLCIILSLFFSCFLMTMGW